MLLRMVDKNAHWSVSLLANSSVSALIGNVGPSDNMFGLSFNMAHTFQNGRILKCLGMFTFSCHN